MKSMTGYGNVERQFDRFRLGFELRGYNNRFLEIRIVAPSWMNPLETWLRASIANRISRGTIEATIMTWGDLGSDIFVDHARSAALTQALKSMARTVKIDRRVRIEHLLRFEDVIVLNKTPDVTKYREALQVVVEECLQQFDAVRMHEGAATERQIMEQLKTIERQTAAMEGDAERLEEKITTLLRTRFQHLLGDEMSEMRLYTETAAQLAKHSMGEEFARIQAHLAAFRDTLGQEKPMGKRLDFICQELHREINTIASKNLLTEIGAEIIDIKEAIELIREQLRNVE